MNAVAEPVAAAGAVHRLVPLDLLTPSPTNPRTSFPQASIAELAATIEPHGVMQPLLVRPNPMAAAGDGRPPYEIVAGERRWRSCRWLDSVGRTYPHAGQVPILLRNLTDREVLQLQLIENIQREDLQPLEEADHYWRMVHHATEPSTVDEVAETIGKSVNYVYGRMTLRKLVPAARDAMREGKLDLSKALKVAAMPAEKQPEIVAHITTWGGEPMGARAAARYIHDTFMLRLDSAPFNVNDAALVPSAGACATCPKRTDRNPGLFTDVAEGDRCMDAACFGAKREAFREGLLRSAKEVGYIVLEGDAAKGLLTRSGDVLNGWHDLRSPLPANLANLANPGEAALTVEDVIGRAGVDASSISVAVHPTRDALVYAVPTLSLDVALRSAGLHVDQARHPAAPAPASRASAPAPPPPPPAAQRPKAKAKTESLPAYDPLDDVLKFDVLPVGAKRVDAAMMQRCCEVARQRLTAGLVAHKVSSELRDRGAQLGLMLPDGVAQLLAVIMLYLVDEFAFAELSKLFGVAPISQDTDALLMTQQDASCVVLGSMALLDERDPVIGGPWHMHVAPLLGIAHAAVAEQAREIVDERARLELLARGTAAGGAGEKKAPAGAAAVKYRDAATGSSWSGRGLQPKWLKVALAAGRKLSDFEVGASASGAKTAAKKAAPGGAGGKGKSQTDKAFPALQPAKAAGAAKGAKKKQTDEAAAPPARGQAARAAGGVSAAGAWPFPERKA